MAEGYTAGAHRRSDSFEMDLAALLGAHWRRTVSRRGSHAFLGILTLLCAGCASSGFSQSVWNPFGLKPLFGPKGETIRIAIVDSHEGVFDTADWAFIQRRAPWEPLARALSSSIGHPVEFRQLKPFQIAYHLQTGRCQFALVSGDTYQLLADENVPATVLAEAEVLRRQGVIVANAKSKIRSLADLKGKRFAFGPRTDPILFYAALEVLDRAGISPSDLRQELVLTGFDGSLQNRRSSRMAAKEIAYGVGTDAGVIEAAEYDAYPETGGRWLPLFFSFSKDQFVELARTEAVEAVTLTDATFIAGVCVEPELADKVRAFLTSAHKEKPEVAHALGFSRFREPAETDSS